MNTGRHDVENALSASRGDSPSLDNVRLIGYEWQSYFTYLLYQKGHRECLVKYSELPTLALLVVWIPKYSTVEQRSMYISDHTSDVSCGIRRFPGRWVLDAIEVVDGRRVEVQRITLIE